VRRGGFIAQLLASARMLAAAVMLVGSAAILAGCASTVQQEIAKMPPTSVQELSYYPFQVKGYQNSYPHKRILVLMPVDARDFKDAGGQNHQPLDGNPATGVVLGPSGAVVQRIYSQPLPQLVQQAIVKSAEEAGMVASASNATLDAALKQVNEDYILTSRITRCWVNKHDGGYPRSSNGSASPLWFTTADVSLEVTIYKPPFDVPFWQGVSTDTYKDPPADNGSGVGEEIAIYAHPGQVLSVALTRVVAGIFKREALHTLVLQDTIRPRASN
jgi:hypothetical protein